jgi:hypothetical protein
LQRLVDQRRQFLESFSTAKPNPEIAMPVQIQAT